MSSNNSNYSLPNWMFPSQPTQTSANHRGFSSLPGLSDNISRSETFEAPQPQHVDRPIPPSFQQNNAVLPPSNISYPSSGAGSTAFSLHEQREGAKTFIKVLYDHNYGYDDLVKEDLDPNILKGLYEELGIPTTRLVVSSTNGSHAQSETVSADSASADRPVEMLRNSDRPSKKSQDSPAQGREAYLAKLAAAKSLKNAESQKPQSLTQDPPTSTTGMAVPVSTIRAGDSRHSPTPEIQDPPAPSRTASARPESRKAELDLLKKAALQTLRSRHTASVPSSEANGNMQRQTLKNEAEASAAPRTTVETIDAHHSGGLPGLTLTSPEQALVERGSFIWAISEDPSKGQPVVAAERISPGDFINDFEHEATIQTPPSKRRFGSGRFDDENEECVIELSEDEADRTPQPRSQLDPSQGSTEPTKGNGSNNYGVPEAHASGITTPAASPASHMDRGQMDRKIAMLKSQIKLKEKMNRLKQKLADAEKLKTVSKADQTAIEKVHESIAKLIEEETEGHKPIDALQLLEPTPSPENNEDNSGEERSMTRQSLSPDAIQRNDAGDVVVSATLQENQEAPGFFNAQISEEGLRPSASPQDNIQITDDSEEGDVSMSLSEASSYTGDDELLKRYHNYDHSSEQGRDPGQAGSQREGRGDVDPLMMVESTTTEHVQDESDDQPKNGRPTSSQSSSSHMSMSSDESRQVTDEAEYNLASTNNGRESPAGHLAQSAATESQNTPNDSPGVDKGDSASEGEVVDDEVAEEKGTPREIMHHEQEDDVNQIEMDIDEDYEDSNNEHDAGDASAEDMARASQLSLDDDDESMSIVSSTVSNDQDDLSEGEIDEFQDGFYVDRGSPHPHTENTDHISRQLNAQKRAEAEAQLANKVSATEPEDGIQLDEPVNGESRPSSSSFSPYQSPLAMFKGFRYHPEFSKTVQGGYNSLTYSHNIDPNAPLCEYELAGGNCNDSRCRNQHFRSMGLSGNDALIQLSSSNPGKTEEERRVYSLGLQDVLRGLTARGAPDAETVASAIIDYRRRFINDPSRVLGL